MANNMNRQTKKSIAILGGGISGLYAAYRLQKLGFTVTIFERADELGGLSGSFKIGQIYLEKFYHHSFTTDKIVQRLIKELDLDDKFYYKRLSTAILHNNQTYPLNGAVDLLKLSPLSFLDRLRTGIVLAFLKKTKKWKQFSKEKANDWLPKWQGRKSYELLWLPLFRSKFGKYWDQMSMAWFWARIYLRSEELGYIEGGFQILFKRLHEEILKNHGGIIFQAPIDSVRPDTGTGRLEVSYNRSKLDFDFVLSTLPESTNKKIFPDLKADFLQKYSDHHHVGAQTLILLLDRRFLDHYWLNVNDQDFPFLVVVDQSYIADVSEYGGLYPVYFGNYLNYDDPRWTMSETELLKKFVPFIKKLRPDFSEKWIKEKHLFRTEAAQFVITTDYEKTLLPNKLPIKNCYAATLSQIFPAERSLNYSMSVVDNAIAQIIEDMN
ncbi:MAG: hypothetical protein ACD_83C00023G0002 [uncultured bacterium]|nr:MAG: hypothetical protein ACD_83C00023G0002 [uncultured bacterium]